MNLQIQRIGERKLLGRISQQSGDLHLINLACRNSHDPLTKSNLQRIQQYEWIPRPRQGLESTDLE